MRNLLQTTILIFLCFSVLGCSSHPDRYNGNPGYHPTLPDDNSPVLPNDFVPSEQTSVDDINNSNRELMGQWVIVFDLKSLSVESVSQRKSEAHINLTTLLSAPDVTINSYDQVTRNLDADFTLTNSLESDLYDVRLILYSDNAGHKLLNPDDWTAIYDISEGDAINPFKAYAKDQPQRIFGQNISFTENLQIYLPGDDPSIIVAIDGCLPDNCTEPYSIENFTQGELLDYDDTSTTVEITVKDWQNDVSRVSLFCPDISGDTRVPFSQSSGDKWKAELVNLENAQAGNYSAVITAESSNSGSLALYNKVSISVSKADPPVNAKVVAEMPGLYVINDFVVRGDNAYVTDGLYGLKIADISDPDHLKILSILPLDGSCMEIQIIDDLAVIRVGTTQLKIINIADPLNPCYLSQITSTGINVSLGYAISGDCVFVADSLNGLAIYNISDQSNPFLEKKVQLPEMYYNYLPVPAVSIRDNYLFICSRGYLSILNVSLPGYPFIGMLSNAYASKILLNGNYAYLCAETSVSIVDISNPSTPQTISTISGFTHAAEFEFFNDYIFCTMDWKSMNSAMEHKIIVLDVHDPSKPETALEFETPWTAVKLSVSDEILYVSSRSTGIMKLDICEPENPDIIAKIRGSINTQYVAFHKGYLYTYPGNPLDNSKSISSFDVSEPVNPVFKSRLECDTALTYYPSDLVAAGSLLFALNQGNPTILDLAIPDMPQPLSAINTEFPIFSLISEGMTAFMCSGKWVDSTGGFDSYDVSNPSDPILKNSTQLDGVAWQISTSGDRAYLPLDTGSLAILDISNPNAVTILGSLDLGFRAVNVAVKDDIVYVSSLKKTKIIDTSDPKNLIYTGDLEHHMMNPTVMKTIVHGSYMYVAYDRNGTSVGGIAIYDVSIPESPQIISYLLFGSSCTDIVVHGNYAYVAAFTEGIKVIQLRE